MKERSVSGCREFYELEKTDEVIGLSFRKNGTEDEVAVCHMRQSRVSFNETDCLQLTENSKLFN
jgi:hypothetical protein